MGSPYFDTYPGLVPGPFKKLKPKRDCHRWLRWEGGGWSFEFTKLVGVGWDMVLRFFGWEMGISWPVTLYFNMSHYRLQAVASGGEDVGVVFLFRQDPHHSGPGSRDLRWAVWMLRRAGGGRQSPFVLHCLGCLALA